jgi:syringate O-demethylase
MTAKTLQDVLDGVDNIPHFLRNQQAGPNAYPGVPGEYSNWRDEQIAWQQTCVLFNQSYHMVDLRVEGPDAFAMLNSLGINSFKGFVPDRAKQFVPVSHDGHVIGDVILFYLSENTFNLVGRAPTIEWVEFHAATGGWDVQVTRDERTAVRPDPQNRRGYRYQIQGPHAMKLMEKALGQTPPELKFFHMTTLTIGGRQVRALRHGMAGQPGFELFGPWEERDEVHAALVAAGADFGLKLVGGRTYSSNTLESGWIPSPLPAVYTGEAMRPYREWLPANSYEGKASLGGSFYSDNIEDYYLTPWDLGYGPFVKFDHDFIGKEALEKKQAGPHKKKVTLALDSEDLVRIMSSYFQKGDRAKFFEFPSAVYTMHQFDRVLGAGGKDVGLSTWVGYSANEGRGLTLAMLDEEHAKPGTQVTLLWGEEDGGSSKPTVERHVQTEIRATVSPAPYSEVARDAYADSWRTRQSA